jgi:hypothetical protein
VASSQRHIKSKVKTRGCNQVLQLTSLPLCTLLRYEEELALRATAETEFVLLKKVSDFSHMAKNGVMDTGNWY